MQTCILFEQKLLIKLKNTVTLVCFKNLINKDRWPNWIRRSATNREIPDSSSGRSTKKEKMLDWLFKASLQKSVIYFFIIVLIILLILTFVL